MYKVIARPLICLLLALTPLACGPSPEEVKVDREEIRQNLEAYLPKLGEAYATGNIELLRGMAVEKELAHVDKKVTELAQEGRVLAPELRELTIEDVTLWSHNNAYVTTVEIWDVKSYVLGSDRLLSEDPDQAQRVKYQLKRRPEGWQILYRQVEQTFE